MRAFCTSSLLAVCTAIGAADVSTVAKDYRSELIGPPAKSGKPAQVTVRLVHIPDGMAVHAKITDVKFDIGAAGMAGLVAPAKAMPAKEPRAYMIETQPSMAGAWGLTLTAEVKSEAEPVRDTVVITVPK